MSYKKSQGVSLVEAMLVLVIASLIIYMGLRYTVQKAEQNRIDRTALQMQQILNAALAYYVANGTWPLTPNISSLSAYLTPNIVSPWGGLPYRTAISAGGTNLFYVYTTITSATVGKASSLANTIAGLLPMGYATTAGSLPPAFTACVGGTTCIVAAAVNVPGQSLTTARGVNWAGLVHHGGCIPVPVCPVDQNGNTMTPQVFVVPVSVSGVNDPGTSNAYPVSSFTGYATGPAVPGVGPPYCNVAGWGVGITGSCEAAEPTLGHWRACAQVVTEKGDVSATRGGTWPGMLWGQYITLLAMTRCTTAAEPTGGGMWIYSN